MIAIDTIPCPYLTSWMHERVNIPQESPEERLLRYNNEGKTDYLIDSLMSSLLTKTKLISSTNRWIFYRIMCKIATLCFKGLNWLDIHGRENIPKNGALFYVNHTSAIDPAILMAAFGYPVAFFVDSGYGWMADMLETVYGFVSHQGSNAEIIERMVRAVLKKNPFFAIWPEGVYEKHGILRGFSGIVRVYAVLNSRKNVIPFVPVIIQGGECFNSFVGLKLGKIRVDFLPPRFLPRQFLLSPSKGGKNPREIMDQLMLILARSLGQDQLGKNWYLGDRPAQ